MTDSTAGPSGPDEPRETLPLEDSGQPYPSRVLETVRLFVINPSEGFRRMSDSTDLLLPMSYALVFAVFQALAEFVWSWVIPFGPWLLWEESFGDTVSRAGSGLIALVCQHNDG